MKIAEKRNRNKMKIDHKTSLTHKNQQIYKSEHGPYKIVSFINLGGDMTKVKEDFFDNTTRKMFYCKQKMQNFMFIDTSALSDLETSYITRTSDIVVCLVNTNKIDEKALSLVKHHLPTCILAVLDRKYLKSARKFSNQYLPDRKVIDISALLDYLCILKIDNTKISSRPFMVPLTVESIEENILTVKGFMKKGPLTNKVIINGKYEGEILEIRAETTFEGKELGMSDEDKSQFVTVQGFDDDQMEIVDENSESNEGNSESDYQMEIVSEDSESDDRNYESEEDDKMEVDDGKYPSLIDKYSEYRGIRNIATCDFPTNKYPEYYKNLLFFQDYKHVNKIITRRKSLISDNQMVEIKVKINQPITDKIFVMFGYYEFEEYKTIHNYTFEQGTALRTGERVFVDLGHKIMEVIPTITKFNYQSLHKREESLTTGVISFIAPLSFDMHKILIFESNPLRELSKDTYKILGMNIGIKEKKLYDEIVLRGLPIKIHKRSCTVKRMFYSKEEVLFYKDIRLYTKNGRSNGYIKKPLGVHGSFKAYFSHPIASSDKIYMSLYKRAFLEDYPY